MCYTQSNQKKDRNVSKTGMDLSNHSESNQTDKAN